MINCPHCGETLFHVPPDAGKLSKQQAVIYRMFVDNPTRIYTVDDIARRMYAFDPNGGALNSTTVVHIQIHRIRKRLGDVIETTNSGYRLRLVRNNVKAIKSTTESETK